MVGMYGIGPVPGPANTVSTQAAHKESDKKSGAMAGDAAVFSRSAADVAIALSAQEKSDTYEAFRQERLEEARQNLEQGLHKVQGLIEVVASRVTQYIEPEA